MVETVRRVPAMRRRKNIRYAHVAKVGYEEIQQLRDDGYSYDTIRDDLVARGVFEEGAASGNLCSAFLRERKRRAMSERPEAERSGWKEAKKPRESETPTVIHEVPKPEPAKPNIQKKSEEREFVRKITGSTEETGLGKLTRHSDGSFDFDWK
jgi:hypothetical protein